MVTDLYVSCAAGDCLTQAVKEFPDTAHVPVICLGEQTQAEFRRALEVGADAFLPSDVEPTALLDAVERLLVRSAWRDDTGETGEDDRDGRPAPPRSLARWAVFRRRHDIGLPR